LIGLLGALTGVVVAFYATAGSILLVGSVFMLLGLIRILLPSVFDILIERGAIQLGPLTEFFDQLSVGDQGLIIILLAGVFIAGGLGMLWLGRYLLRGLRFLFSLVFDWMRRFAQSVGRRLRPARPEGLHAGGLSFVNGDR
jgi:hypothetical protein